MVETLASVLRLASESIFLHLSEDTGIHSHVANWRAEFSSVSLMPHKAFLKACFMGAAGANRCLDQINLRKGLNSGQISFLQDLPGR